MKTTKNTRYSCSILSQLSPGENRALPIAFVSKSLTRAQDHYQAHCLEFLCLKWAVCDKLSHWLKGHKFTAWTDNNPLTHISTKPRPVNKDGWQNSLLSSLTSNMFLAQSRQPFVDGRVSHRIVWEPYNNLVA